MLMPLRLAKKSVTLANLVLRGDWYGILCRLAGVDEDIIPGKFRNKGQTKANNLQVTKRLFVLESRQMLEEFFATGADLYLPNAQNPDITVLLVLYNKAELTFRCLQSLAAQASESPSCRVRIVDNGSSDETRLLLQRVRGAEIILNDENLGYLEACNRALSDVTTGTILLLNNDTIVHPGAIAAAYDTLRNTPKAGAVGARIILPDNSLQEAGNILWRDGTCVGYLRGHSPEDGRARFRRRTDYCSGAFLMTHADIWHRIGGYDARYKPAYYEETDFCIAVQRLGLDIWYEPNAAITHFEFGSSELSSKAFAQMTINREKFVAKNSDYLSAKLSPESSHYIARHADRRPRVLVIEDLVPHQYLGAGFPRSNAIIKALSELNWQVTVFTSFIKTESWWSLYADLPRDVEIIHNRGFDGLREFLAERTGEFDVAWICRPHNMEAVHKLIDTKLITKSGVASKRIIYDAEALFSARESLEKKVLGKASAPKKRRMTEFELVAYADDIVSVSAKEAKIWAEKTDKPVTVVGHDIEIRFTERSFSDRKDILFLGSIHNHPSPNSDSLLWFLEQVWPQLKGHLGQGAKLVVVGYNALKDVSLFASYATEVRWVGKVEDLAPYFDACRLMVVPTRYASGIPQKVYDAASFGMPCVCTDLIADQMGWVDGVECLVSSHLDPEMFGKKCAELYNSEVTWQTLRAGMLKYLQEHQREMSIKDRVKELLTKVSVHQS